MKLAPLKKIPAADGATAAVASAPATSSTTPCVTSECPDWSGNRYELGAFRFTTAQYVEAYGSYSERYAAPYWGFSLSRRWRLWGRSGWGVFVGAGAS